MTEESEVLSPSRIERLLELASVYNVPLTVTAESRDKTYRYKSRMLDLEKTPGASTLVVDIPVTDGPAIALTPDTEITVFFALDRERFLFHTKVLRKISFSLANRRKITALEIEYPNVLINGQRRSYYRVLAPTGKPISVVCGETGNAIDWFVQEPGAWNFPSRTQFAGRILNISVGGMLMAVEKAGRTAARTGAKLGLRFTLASSETPIVLKGIIKRAERETPTGEYKVAIEFIDTDEKFEYKLAMNRLYRYVAERQRETITSAEK